MDKKTAGEISSILVNCLGLKAQKKFADAHVILKNIYTLFPLDPVINLHYAYNLKDLGLIDQAEKIADEFINLKPTAEFIGLKYEILWQKNRQNECIDLILNSVAKGIYSYDLVIHAALFMLEKQDLTSATQLIKTFLEQHKIPRQNHNHLKTVILIINYLEGNIAACRKALPGLAKGIENKNQFNHDLGDMLDIYLQYLNSLLAFRSANPQLYPTFECEKIYMLGDSHCLSPAYMQVSYKNKTYQITPKLIFGSKAWHFYKGSPKTRIEGFKNIIASLPPQSIVFISIGEIDCHINEGFFLQYMKDKNYDLEKNISEVVNGLVNFVETEAAPKNLELKFFSTPAPNPVFYRHYIEKMTSEEIQAYLSTVRIFNKTLREKVGDAKFIDLYTVTALPNGSGNPEYFIDNVHLLPNIYAEIIKNLT